MKTLEQSIKSKAWNCVFGSLLSIFIIYLFSLFLTFNMVTSCVILGAMLVAELLTLRRVYKELPKEFDIKPKSINTEQLLRE